MFDLYNEVFKKAGRDKKQYSLIEDIRKENLKNETILDVEDLGAGSQFHSSTKRSIKSIAAKASKPKKYARFLAELAFYLKSKEIIELGTSLGFTSLYLAQRNPDATINTIEGSQAIRELAMKNFRKAKISNVESLAGNFDLVIPVLLEKKKGFDLLYIDGNHTSEATLRYFELAKKYASNSSVIVFDDIYWNEDMTTAWETIKKDSAVTATIDLFEFGIIFFKKELSKQDFILKY